VRIGFPEQLAIAAAVLVGATAVYLIPGDATSRLGTLAIGLGSGVGALFIFLTIPGRPAEAGRPDDAGMGQEVGVSGDSGSLVGESKGGGAIEVGAIAPPGGDPVLGDPALPVISQPAPTVPLHSPPHPPDDFVGRVALRNALVKHARSSKRVLALYASGGHGKTALLAKVLEEVTDDYRDGRLYLDMREM